MFLLSTINVLGQTIKLIDNLLPAYRRAELLYSDDQFNDAAYYYTKAYKKDSANIDLIKKIAISHQLASNHVSAVKWYDHLINESSNISSDTWMNYALSLMVVQNYEGAKKCLDQSIVEDKQNLRAQKIIESLNHLNELYADSNTVQIRKLTFDENHRDFCSVSYNDGIVFLSNRQESNSGNALDWGDNSYIKYYFSKEREDGVMSEPIQLFTEFDEDYHYGPLAFYNAERNVVFSRMETFKLAKRKPQSKIYHAAYDEVNDEWHSIAPIAFENDEYSNGHPTINKDGTILVFSSNRSGGIGGSDLYMSIKNGDQWGEPKNLGEIINSSENEVFPYFETNETLVFSSNGHGGLGDLDLFRVNINDLQNTVVENLGYPINSSYADFGYSSSNDNTQGFFSSNRANGGWDDDIYSFVRSWCKINIHVTNLKNSNPIHEVKVEMVISDHVKDTKYSNLKGELGFISLMGKEDIELKVSKEGYDPYTTVVTANQLSSGEELEVDLTLSELPTPSKDKERIKNSYRKLQEEYNRQKTMVLVGGRIYEYREIGSSRFLVNADEKILLAKEIVDPEESIEERARKAVNNKGLNMEESFTLKNIYFDKDAIELSGKAKLELDKVSRIMKIDKQVAFEISSFTDSDGSMTYNNELAFKRSQFIARYLMSQDVAGSRLILESYGEQGLTNDCDNNKTCDELYHALNRRAELKLMLRKIYN